MKRGMRFAWIACGMIVAACCGAWAQAVDPQVMAACEAELKTPLPVDLGKALVPKVLDKCDSYKLYDKKEWAAARRCAIRERAARLPKLSGSPRNPTEDIPVGGPVVLALEYANGEGVERNPALAARFWCEGVWTGEIEAGADDKSDAADFLKSLVAIKAGEAGGPGSARFEVLCRGLSGAPDGIPWTQKCQAEAEEEHAMMHRGGITEAYEDAEKSYTSGVRAMIKLKRTLTPPQLVAYQKMKTAFDRFIQVNITANHIDSPPYSSGGIGPPTDFARESMYGGFYDAVQAGLHGDVILGIQMNQTYEQADSLLNENWQKLLAVEAGDAERVAQLRTEQRAWLAYRDAFLAFGVMMRGPEKKEVWGEAVTNARASGLELVADIEGSRSNRNRR